MPGRSKKSTPLDARRLSPVTRVAATVTVIRTDDRGTLAATSSRVVRYEPGLSVRNDPFRFGLDTFAIRGLTGDRVAVEVDGIPSAGGFAIGSISDSGRGFVGPCVRTARGSPAWASFVAVRQ